MGDRRVGGGKRKADQLILQLHVPDSGPPPRVPTFHFLGQWHMECLYSHPVTAEKILINILESLV